MCTRSLVGLIVLGVLVVVTGCWPMPNRMSVSPDGSLALTMPDETSGLYEAFPSSGSIWIIDPRTGQVQSVLTGGENLSWATFSPDGQELLYVEGPRVGIEQILTVTKALSHPWRVMLFDRQKNIHTELFSGDHGFVWGPTFSPDGSHIAYYRGDGESRLGLYLFDRTTRQQKFLKLIQDAQGLYYAPYGPELLWTPDGRGLFLFRVAEILPTSALPSPQEITPETVRVFSGRLEIINIECGCEQALLRGFFPLLPTPLYLIAFPDGQQLYVNGYDQTFSITAQEKVNLYKVTGETGEKVAVYDGGGIALAPALSPNGENLLFTVISPAHPPKADLYFLNLSSPAPPRPLTDDGRSGFGVWLSDEEFVFLRAVESDSLPRAEIWVKDIKTGQERNLSPLLAAQQSVSKLTKEKQAYQDELVSTRQALQRVTEQIAALTQSIRDLSAKLDTVQTQSRQLSDQIAQQLSALVTDTGALKIQMTELDASVKAAQERPALALWQLVIALIVVALGIIWAIRRALHQLAQQLAFPPQ